MLRYPALSRRSCGHLPASSPSVLFAESSTMSDGLKLAGATATSVVIIVLVAFAGLDLAPYLIDVTKGQWTETEHIVHKDNGHNVPDMHEEKVSTAKKSIVHLFYNLQ